MNKNAGLLLIVAGVLVFFLWLGNGPDTSAMGGAHPGTTHPKAYQLAALLMLVITARALRRIWRGGRRDQ